MNYLKWNDAIAEKVFSPVKEDQTVLLTVDKDLIEEIGDLDDYMNALRKGPPWFKDHPNNPKSLCVRALDAYEDWRLKRREEYPPYIAYLGIFVLAAQDSQEDGYWKSLKRLIAPLEVGSPPHKKKVTEEVWGDLETWSLDDRNGDLGNFENNFRVQEYLNVGLIRAQTIIRPNDSERLPNVFYESGLDPTVTPSSNELREIASSVSPMLKRFVGSEDKWPLLEIILRSHFEKWDGLPSGDDYQGEPRPRGTLLLSIRRHSRTGEFILGLRAKTMFQYPAEGFQLKKEGAESTWIAKAQRHQLSRIIVDSNGVPYTVTEADLSQNFGFFSSGIRFSLLSSRTRVFVPGHSQGIDDHLETRQAPNSGPMLLLVTDSVKDQLLKFERDFNALQVRSLQGQMDGWHLFSCKGVLDNKNLKTLFNCFDVRPLESPRLVGGIKARRGSRSFMSFGPPKLEIPSSCESEELSVWLSWDGKRVPVDGPDESGIRELPTDLPIDKTLSIKFERAGIALFPPLAFSLVQKLELGRLSQNPQINASGDFVPRTVQEGPRMSGPIVKDGVRVEGADIALMHEQLMRSEKVVFLGRDPKEHSVWPDRAPPVWEVVWVVSYESNVENRPRLAFTDPPPERCSPGLPNKNEPTHRKWVKCILDIDANNDVVKDERDGELWQRYVEAASTNRVHATEDVGESMLARALREARLS